MSNNRKIILCLSIVTLIFIILIITLMTLYFVTQNEMFFETLNVVLTVGNLLATIACGMSIFIIYKRQLQVDTYIARFLLLGMIIFFIINISSFVYNGFVILTS